MPYAPLPGGGGILPAVSSGPGSGGCRPVLLGGVDLSMSAAVQPVATLPTLPSSGPPPHNPLHHTPGGLALPPLGSAPVMMPRPPTTTMPSLGPSLPPSHQDAADLAEAAPNQDVLLALLARNKNLEGKDSLNLLCFCATLVRPIVSNIEANLLGREIFYLWREHGVGSSWSRGLRIFQRCFRRMFLLFVREFRQ